MSKVWLFLASGKAKHVFAMFKLLATTEPIKTDKHWWEIRAYLLAHDMTRDKRVPLVMRNN